MTTLITIADTLDRAPLRKTPLQLLGREDVRPMSEDQWVAS